jgi:hypothetical protein
MHVPGSRPGVVLAADLVGKVMEEIGRVAAEDTEGPRL